MALILAEGLLNGSMQVINEEMTLTIPDTIGKPLLKHVFRDDQMQLGFNTVKVLVARFLHSFGFSNKPNESQIEIITVDVLENFGHESLEDVIIFFKMARSGKFGTTGRGVDSNVIFGDWFPKYMEMKSDEREKQYKNQKNQINSQPTISLEEVKDIRLKAENTMEKKRERCREWIEKESQHWDRQALEDTITDWEKKPKFKIFIDILKAKRKDFPI